MSRQPQGAEWARYAQIGMLLVAPMGVLGAAGHWLDRRWGTGPWLLLAGLLLGMASGFVSFLRVALAAGDGPRKEEPK